jgi:hypothetical protein
VAEKGIKGQFFEPGNTRCSITRNAYTSQSNATQQCHARIVDNTLLAIGFGALVISGAHHAHTSRARINRSNRTCDERTACENALLGTRCSRNRRLAAVDPNRDPGPKS